MKNIRSRILVSLISLSIGTLCLGMEGSDNEFSIVEKYCKNPSALGRGGERISINKKMIVWRHIDEGKPQYVVTDSSFESLEETAKGIEGLIEFAKKREDEFKIEWRVFSDKKPHVLGEVLKSKGFSLYDSLDVMTYSLDQSLEHYIEIDPAIKVDALTDKSLIPAWASIVGAAFQCSDCDSEAYHQTVEKGINKLSDEEFYAGYYNEQLAATGGMRIFKDECIGVIFAGTTHPDFRNKGLATAISLYILRRAKELDLKCIVFMTSNPYIIKICKKGQCTRVFDNYRYRLNYSA